MTSLSLLLWIVLGITAQLAVFLTVLFLRHWSDYQRLRFEASGQSIPSAPEVIEIERQPNEFASTGFRPFRVARKVVEDAGRTACSFYLEPEDKQRCSSFLPGQFLTFRLDIPQSDGGTEQVIRCYSLSDAPQPNYYRVTIKRVPAPPGQAGIPPGRASSFFHGGVKEGDILQVRAPSGHFCLDAGMSPVVLIAAGIGITPMLSMLNWSLSKQDAREIWLFYGVRNSREHVMKAHLEALAAQYENFRLHVCYSDPLPEDIAGHDFQHSCRMSVDLLRLHLPLKPYQFYICGPTPMMESLVPALYNWGVPDERIHFEAFGPASIKRCHDEEADKHDEASANIMVTFAKSGRSLPWSASSGSLLEFAESHKIPVMSGCRAGGCGTCQTTIRAGEIAYRRTPDFDPAPGSCLLCVSIPQTSVTLEA